jgi:hypothetical protein
MRRKGWLVAAIVALALLVVCTGAAATGNDGRQRSQGKPPAKGVKAYAVVVPGEVSLNVDPLLVAPFSKGFRSVRSPAFGIYCLTPGRGIDPFRTPLVVSPEYDYSSARATALLVSWALGAKACGPRAFEVRTFTLTMGPAGPVTRPSEGVAFVAMAP